MLLLVGGAAAGSGCAGAVPLPDRPEPPAPVGLTTLLPTTVLPRSRFILKGNNFVETATHELLLEGKGSRGEIAIRLPLKVVNVERAEAATDDAFFNQVGAGKFLGTATVVSSSLTGETIGDPLPVSLQLARHLTPRITTLGAGLVYLNSRVPVEGDSLLLGGAEGQTVAEVKGCFLAAGTGGPCETAGRQVAARIPLKPAGDGDRRRASFEFSPAIAGPRPGTLQGTVGLFNLHSDGYQTASGTQAAAFQLEPTRLLGFQPGAVSLGQFLEIRGAGFVGPPGSTLIHFSGTFTPKGGIAQSVTFDVVPGYEEGGLLRYVLDEEQGLGKLVNLRTSWGTLAGTCRPTVIWGTEQVEGLAAEVSVQVAPVKQVVWVRFSKSWTDSLRRFGLTAADLAIRRRVVEAMRRDYAGINVEFRENEPKDFKLYAKIDIGGMDPNGLGLLGYDNTPGKDVDNKRLYDWLGGVNALTQQDGYPGYGGVFLESMLGFSQHPPSGIQKSPLATPLFDELFDPFRPDMGKELTTAELLEAPQLSSTEGCPADDDRAMQAACAVLALGNVVATTASHEFGHSLGLANPYGAPTDFHNPGDAANRLMDSGGDRPFAERAELQGHGPAVFCDEEYDYLKKILPLDPPKDPKVVRPGCY